MSQWDRELPSACPGDGFTVYYDGACPLCAKEIDSYRRLQGADAIDWIDVSPCESGRLGGDLDRDAALMRLHVRCADGTLIDGAAAFATLRQQLPALARMGRLASQPVLLAVLESGYAAFLRVRRLWRTRASILPQTIVADLRTDHAGETGAVMIYCGILAVTRDDTVRAFAENHLATEARHLAAIEDVLPATRRSLALPLWRIAGWLTGALPALAGPRAVYAAIEAVETFVYRHYAAQVGRINTLDPHRREPTLQALRTLLEHCREDETHIVTKLLRKRMIGRTPGCEWTRLVAVGSAAAVAVRRRI